MQNTTTDPAYSRRMSKLESVNGFQNELRRISDLGGGQYNGGKTQAVTEDNNEYAQSDDEL